MDTTLLDTIYRDVPPEQRRHLEAFRAAHPYKRLTVNGVVWEYIASGRGDEAVLILGGGMSTGESSFSRIEQLEGEFRVISPSYPLGISLDAALGGLAAILDTEGIERAHVIGHSLGAGLAHAFVRRHPQRADKLVLSGFGLYTPLRLKGIRLFLWLFRMLPFRFLQRYYIGRFKKLLAGTDNPEARFMLAYSAELLLIHHSKESVLGQLNMLREQFEHPDVMRTYEPVQRPGQVLIITAKDDTGFKTPERHALWATYPGAHIHEFDSGGHLAGVTRRDEYNELIESFLKETSMSEIKPNVAVSAVET